MNRQVCSAPIANGLRVQGSQATIPVNFVGCYTGFPVVPHGVKFIPIGMQSQKTGGADFCRHGCLAQFPRGGVEGGAIDTFAIRAPGAEVNIDRLGLYPGSQGGDEAGEFQAFHTKSLTGEERRSQT